MSHPLVIAHRGASQDAPENTHAAFAIGWEQNADGLEIDIHLTKDGRIVVMHDSDTLRTTGVEGAIAEQTLAQLRKLDVGHWKGAVFVDCRIPSLDEVLTKLPPGKEVLIEIKCGAEIVVPLQTCLKNSKVSEDQILIHSFDFATISMMKRAAPNLRAHWLLGNQQRDWERLQAEAVAADLDGLNPCWECPISSNFIERAHQAGLEVYSWTVNTANSARHLASLGVDGLITDCPAAIKSALNSEKT